VAEHLLHSLHVGAADIGSEPPWVEGRAASASPESSGRVRLTSFGHPRTIHHRGLSGREFNAVAEDQLITTFAFALLSEQFSKEGRRWNTSRFVALRSSRDDRAANIDRVRSHEDSPSNHVDAVHAEADCFAPTQSRVGEKQDKRAVRARFVGEQLNLRVREVVAFLSRLSRKVCSASRIRRDAPIFDDDVDHAGQNSIGADGDGRALSLRQLSYPRLHLAMPDLAQRATSPSTDRPRTCRSLSACDRQRQAAGH